MYNLCPEIPPAPCVRLSCYVTGDLPQRNFVLTCVCFCERLDLVRYCVTKRGDFGLLKEKDKQWIMGLSLCDVVPLHL